MAGKFALFAFNGEPMCFVHVLLNALDYDAKGYEVKIVLEGEATKLIEHFEKPDVPFAGLYKKCIDRGLLDCVCRACSKQMGVLELAEEKGLPLCDDMSGHPSMERYTKEGYEIITF
ncbi:MAG: DsrE family protein [Spirochaetaceae bacterium]